MRSGGALPYPEGDRWEYMKMALNRERGSSARHHDMEKDEIEVMVAEWQRVREMIEDGRDYEAYAASSTKDWDDEEWDMSQYVGEDGRIKAPRSLPEAMSRPDWPRWEEAYQIEFDMIMTIKAMLLRPMTRVEFREKGVRNKPTPL